MKYIEALHTCHTLYSIENIEEELNISWNDVEEWWIKWHVLHISMKDGSHHEYSKEAGEVDWKRPVSVKTCME